MMSAKSRINLTAGEKRQILDELLKKSNDGNLPHGMLQKTADKFNLERRKMYNIWNTYKDQKNKKKPVKLESNRHNSGRKAIDKSDVLRRMESVPLDNRKSLRSLSTSLSIPTTTLHRHLSSLNIAKKKSRKDPTITDSHKIRRLKWALSWVNKNRRGSKSFDDFQNVIHVDEKWF